MNFIRDWFDRHLADPQVMGLAIVLIVGLALVVVTGDMLAPIIAAVVISYLLEGMVGLFERYRTPRLAGVVLVCCAFMAFLLLVMFALLPLLSRQTSQLVQLLPTMLLRGQDALLKLPETYPELFSENQVRDLIDQIRSEAVGFGQQAVSRSLSSVIGVITIMVYLILLPLMVFFFLKDKHRIISWMSRFLPDERDLLGHVWKDVDRQIGNYVRGKFIEILIVWAACYATFVLMDLQFAMLLAVAVGLSVLIPYIGAVAVTVPVAFVAYFQWGLSSEFAYLMIAYAVVQILDGNILVPVLFSEVVDLHPVAIIAAVLVFGGLWGFWGVFFAIPLATVVQAVLKAWPDVPRASPPAPAGDTG